jgi:hypothetical protein
MTLPDSVFFFGLFFFIVLFLFLFSLYSHFVDLVFVVNNNKNYPQRNAEALMEAPQKVIIDTEPKGLALPTIQIDASNAKLPPTASSSTAPLATPSPNTSHVHPKKPPPLPPTSHPSVLPSSPPKQSSANQASSLDSSTQQPPPQQQQQQSRPRQNSKESTMESVGGEVEIIRTTRKKRPAAHVPSHSSNNTAIGAGNGENGAGHSEGSLALDRSTTSKSGDESAVNGPQNTNNGPDASLGSATLLDAQRTSKASVRGNPETEESDSESTEEDIGAERNPKDSNSIALNLGKISALLKANHSAKGEGSDENLGTEETSKLELENDNGVRKPSEAESGVRLETVPVDATELKPSSSDSIVEELLLERVSEFTESQKIALPDFNDFGDGSIVSVNTTGEDEETSAKQSPQQQNNVFGSSSTTEESPMATNGDTSTSVTLSNSLSDLLRDSGLNTSSGQLRYRPFPNQSSPVRNTLSGNLDTIKILKFNYHVNASYYMIQDLARISMHLSLFASEFLHPYCVRFTFQLLLFFSLRFLLHR